MDIEQFACNKLMDQRFAIYEKESTSIKLGVLDRIVNQVERLQDFQTKNIKDSDLGKQII